MPIPFKRQERSQEPPDQPHLPNGLCRESRILEHCVQLRRAAILRLVRLQFASNDLPTVSHRLRDSVAARICEQRKWASRCITSDLGGTHRFRTVDAKWQKVFDPQLSEPLRGGFAVLY